MGATASVSANAPITAVLPANAPLPSNDVICGLMRARYGWDLPQSKEEIESVADRLEKVRLD